MKKLLLLTATLISFSVGAQQWNALSSGMDKGVNSLEMYNGSLHAGGYFTTAGGSGANYIAKWDGTSWTPLGTGVSGGGSFTSVAAMAVYNGELYAGGIFTSAGGNNANYIAKWNGSTWSPVGTGLDNWVHCMLVFNGELYVGGSFNSAGGNNAAKIAKWNGTSWSAVFGGFTGEVRALGIHNNELYAGGTFNNISKLTSSGWSVVANYNSYVTSIVSDATNNVLYVGGGFTNRVYMLKNSVWSPLGTGITGGTVWGMAMHNNKLYVGGSFTNAGGTAASCIAVWDGASWAAMGTGMDQQVQAFISSGGSLYVGGMFTTASGTSANRIARWGSPSAINEWGRTIRSLDVYPNPFTSSATVELPGEGASFMLFDMTGKLLRQEENISGTSYRLERNDLPSGIYFYRSIDAAGMSYSGKLVID